MLHPSGVIRTRYEDVFRAVGNYLDAERFRDITLVETPDGFLVKGEVLEAAGRTSVVPVRTYLFSNDDLDALLEAALARRGAALPPEERAGSLVIARISGRYEDALRAIGHFIDRESWREVVVMQTTTHFHIKGIAGDQPTDRLLDATAMRHLLAEVRNERGKPRRWRRRFGFS